MFKLGVNETSLQKSLLPHNLSGDRSWKGPSYNLESYDNEQRQFSLFLIFAQYMFMQHHKDPAFSGQSFDP